MHIIDYLKYIFLAILQGISEILPISSSGHLQIVQKYFAMDISNLSLSIFLHLGSLVAIIFFYRKQLGRMMQSAWQFLFKKNRTEQVVNDFRLIGLLIISSVPAAIAGFLLKRTIEGIFADIFYIGLSFILTGICLLVTKNKSGIKEQSQMSMLDALVIGGFQAIGIIPGISRSGITLIGNKMRKIENQTAADYTFLLFIPVALGSFLIELFDIFQGTIVISSTLILPYIIGIIISGIATYFSLKWLLKIIKKGKLYYFAYYLFIVGLVVILLNF